MTYKIYWLLRTLYERHTLSRMMGGKEPKSTVLYFQGKRCSPIKINEHESVTLKGCDGFPGRLGAISFFLLNHASYVTTQRALMPANVCTQEKTSKEFMNCLVFYSSFRKANCLGNRLSLAQWFNNTGNTFGILQTFHYSAGSQAQSKWTILP